ncbi:MAG: hypothetical protein ACT4QB_20810 [Gammaproteobacteria bacterium]
MKSERTQDEDPDQVLMVTVCAIGAKLIHIEDIAGAFLCGIAISQVLGEGPAREKLEFLSGTLSPVFDGSPAYPPYFGTRFVPSRMWYHAL